jgi:antitoxin VapB
MGALYVKDHEAFEMARTLAERRGMTKAAAVKLALANELAKEQNVMSLQERLAEFRRNSPLRFDPTIVIDKAFYDALNDEEDD